MKFNPLALIVSFCVGMLFMILYTPRPTVVVKFPSPGVTSDVYHGTGGSCYRIKSEEVSCPADRKKVVPQPVTEADVSDPMMRMFT